MRYRAFVPYSILGTGLWASAHILVGYFFSRSIDTAVKYAGKGAFLLATLIVVVVGVVFLTRHFRVAENRRAAVRWMEDHAVDPLARRARPPLPAAAALPLGPRHPGRQLRPRVHLADGGPRRRPLRPRRLHRRGRPRTRARPRATKPRWNVAEHLRAGWLTGFTKVFTFLGSGVFTWGLTVVCGALPGRPPPLDRALGPAGRDGDRLDRHPRDQGRGRPAAAAGTAATTTRAPRSPAATPPTRSSTSGWR